MSFPEINLAEMKLVMKDLNRKRVEKMRNVYKTLPDRTPPRISHDVL